MIPNNNKEKFVKKYGNWWYLRDFDFFPMNLADCEYNMTAERMKIVREGKEWAVYDNYHEAVEASRKVRKALGFKESVYPDCQTMTYEF